MADEGGTPPECSSAPDSISEHVASGNLEEPPPLSIMDPVSSELAGTERFTSVPVSRVPVATTSTDTAANYATPAPRIDVPETSKAPGLTDCPITPVISLSKDFHLRGSSTSAFRPFVTQTTLSSAREITSSTELDNPITSTPVSRRAERQSHPGTSRDLADLSRKSPSPPNESGTPVFLNPAPTEENEDGRTTASAPPCTPAPDPYQQPQSPFRGNRQIKKIDLLAMSRSRQSDRAENARRDGRLAPSPRKKDEVLRNSGFALPPRGFGSGFRANLPNPSPVNDRTLSPDRSGNSSLNAASPNVDVVSVDDPQPDPSKCTFSIQFHEFAPAPHMLKCSLCGFVTNNQRFYKRHRRLHSRQYQPSAIRCSLCDYSTTQVRKMREHTITHHHLSHQHSLSNSEQQQQGGFSHPSSVVASTQRPPLQGHMLMSGGGMYQPLSGRPVNVAVGAGASATAAMAADTSGLGLPTYIPAPHDPPIQVNSQGDLQHPPRGNAMLGNYAAASDQQVASYMRSVLTNLMTPASGRGANPSGSLTGSGVQLQAVRSFPLESPTVIPSSTAAAAMEDNYNYRRFWSTGSGNNNNSSSSSSGGGGGHLNLSTAGFVKVKAEPRPVHVTRTISDLPSSTQDRCPRRPSDTFDSESGMDMSSDDHLGSPQPDTDASRLEGGVSASNTHAETSTSSANNGRSTGSVQCSMPFIKIEFPPHTDACSVLTRPHHYTHMDQETQCDILSGSRRHGSRTQSETVSSAGGSVVETRCHFCGVTFDDEVLYSIHVGCHSHTDPFVCNVCGKQCGNKYGFYSHIMRGHLARPNT
ncbi:protein hunchback [Aplysia californica]|uniref:Protein hunchback n=1 Tax=Aplysia californica TaxID=6500 RepID=A0ABM0KB60_APLCA|nr:protein hunchback [Aplysia californica]